MARILPVVAVLLLLPAAARAESYGADLTQTPALGCSSPCSAFTKVASTGTTDRGIPYDAVLTAIRLRHAGAAGKVDIVLIRRTETPNRFLTVQTVAGGQVPASADGATFERTGTLPVQEGDRFAIQVASTAGGELKFAATGAPRACLSSSTVARDGATADYTDCQEPAAVLIEATIEPDTDADGTPDAEDTDDDGDTVADETDNCPLVANLGQRDAERDGLGNFCDDDDDNDGLTDKVEGRKRTSPFDVDTDDDGLTDAAERRTSPRKFDSDGDKLGDGLERGVTKRVPNPPGVAEGTKGDRFNPDLDPGTKTNPRKRDTDRDGLKDGREDKNRDGRVDRGETDPLKRERRKP